MNFRKGAHRLAALAAEMLGQNPFSGVVLVFRSRRADRIKILVWDASGLVLVWKQLEGNVFRYAPGRGAEHARALLRDYGGISSAMATASTRPSPPRAG